MLWHYSRGIDHRQVQTAQELKSIGAEVNWGVRFNNLADVHHFLMNLSREVSLRLQDVSMQGRTFTLKVKKRKKGAGEPAKFMGCGSCDNLSHSVTVPSATDNMDILLRISRQIFASFNLDVREVRGIGLQVSRLQAAESYNQGVGKNSLKSWLASTSKMTSQQSILISNEVKPRSLVAETSSNGQDNVEESHGLRKELGSAESYDDKLKGKGKIHESDPFLPHLSQLDPDVLASLPPEILSEISDVYNIKVVDYFLGNHPVSDRYNIANNNAMEKFSPHTCSKRQEISFPILEGCSSKAVRSDSKNIECDNRHKILKREEEEQRRDSAAKTVWSVDLPASLELDPSVLSALPLSLRLEIEQQYRNNNSLEKKNAPASVSREETANRPQFVTSNPQKNVQEMLVENSRTLTSHTSDLRNMSIGKGGRQASRDDSVSMSMSQLDITVLQELPADMQRGILDSILAQQPTEASHEETLLCKRENSSHTINAYDEVEQKISCVEGDALFEKRLWKGNPPEWVKNFKLSNCVLLKLIAECYNKSGSTQSLSSVLLYLAPSLPQEFLSWSDLQEESVGICSDLFKQYIEDRLEIDIEEIYICFRILKRLLTKSNFWMAVYSTIFPFLQANVGEIYGGDLNL
uniref:DNA repair protein REV1 n=1 Tax=Picea sitchensis TaxID=3332 RepID=D5A7X2_PICSI|nr:unknown [Picea sitchensis]